MYFVNDVSTLFYKKIIKAVKMLKTIKVFCLSSLMVVYTIKESFKKYV